MTTTGIKPNRVNLLTYSENNSNGLFIWAGQGPASPDESCQENFFLTIKDIL